jgi:hypothetical protein
MIIPQENNREALKQREEIISKVYRTWTEKNPSKRVYNRYSKKKEIDRLALLKGHRQIVDV